LLKDRDKELISWLEVNHAISVKQAQFIFFKNYEVARRRLFQLQEMGVLNSYINELTKEKIYYYNKKLTPHDLFKHDFYKKIVEHGGEVIRFDREPRYLNDLIRSDGYFEFKYNNLIYCCILEVDFKHFTDTKKMILYEKLYREGTLQHELGVFPMIVILRQNIDIRYNSTNFDCLYLDFNLSLFNELVLE
jgi:hypothetical protein